MSKLSICFAGLSRQDEAEILSLFKQANARLGNHWVVAPESDAGVLVIDMDSMYGQMSLMKALGTGKTLVALTAGSRADTDHLLQRPVSAESMANLLGALEAGDLGSGQTAAAASSTAQTAPTPASVTAPASAASGVSPATAASPATPPQAPSAAAAPAVAAATGTAQSGANHAIPAAPAAAPAAAAPAAAIPAPAAAPANDARSTLADFLRAGALPGPVRLQRGDAPELVLDPASQTWLGGSALKPLVPYCGIELTDADFTPVAAADLPGLEARLGGRHPFTRLAWLCALSGGSGTLAPGYGLNERFKLLKWPQTEREFPKHFRIATVMMKGPALLTEIAEASGVNLDEVIDYVNASLAVGVAEQDGGAAPASEPARGGLLGRFRR